MEYDDVHGQLRKRSTGAILDVDVEKYRQILDESGMYSDKTRDKLFSPVSLTDVNCNNKMQRTTAADDSTAVASTAISAPDGSPAAVGSTVAGPTATSLTANQGSADGDKLQHSSVGSEDVFLSEQNADHSKPGRGTTNASVKAVGNNKQQIDNTTAGRRDTTSKKLEFSPVASTSKNPTVAGRSEVTGGGGINRSRPMSESLRNQRKSLPLIPRINQYERHPLLQIKSESGLSEFEMLLMEREAEGPRRSSSIVASSSLDRREDRDDEEEGKVGRVGFLADKKLIPRAAHSETHPLFKRSDSGLCEIEQYLLEKEREMSTGGSRLPPSKLAAPKDSGGAAGSSAAAESSPAAASVSASPASSSATASTSSAAASAATASVSAAAAAAARSAAIKSSLQRPSGRVLERRSTLGKLEPRTSQCERHPLLDFRDEHGLSELEKLLREKHEEISVEKKCSVGSTGKNNKKISDVDAGVASQGAGVTQVGSGDQTSVGDVSAGGRPAGLPKRVRFEGQGGEKKEEEGNAGAESRIAGDPGVQDGKAGCKKMAGDAGGDNGGDVHPTSPDDGKAGVMASNDSKSSKKSRRTSGARKSCCLS